MDTMNYTFKIEVQFLEVKYRIRGAAASGSRRN